MDGIKETIAVALARFQDDSDALLSLRLALAVRRQARHRTLRRIRKVLVRRLRQALGSKREDKPAPEMSGVRTACCHPVDQLVRFPPSLPSARITATLTGEQR